MPEAPAAVAPAHAASLKAPASKPAPQPDPKTDPPPVAEVKAEVQTPAPEKPKERGSDRFARVAREEAAIRAERDRVKAKEAEVTAKAAQFESEIKTHREFTELFQKATLKTAEGRAARQELLARGKLNFGDFAQDVVEPEKIDPRAEARAEVERIEAERAKAKEKSDAEAAEKEKAAVTERFVAQTKANLKRVADEGGKKFLLTRKYGESDAAWLVMVEQYKLDKTQLSPETALERVEKNLREQVAKDPELQEALRELVGTAAATEKPKSAAASLKGKPEAKPVGKPEAREPAPNTEAFNPKRHVNELLARHKARLNT